MNVATTSNHNDLHDGASTEPNRTVWSVERGEYGIWNVEGGRKRFENLKFWGVNFQPRTAAALVPMWWVTCTCWVFFFTVKITGNNCKSWYLIVLRFHDLQLFPVISTVKKKTHHIYGTRGAAGTNDEGEIYLTSNL